MCSATRGGHPPLRMGTALHAASLQAAGFAAALANPFKDGLFGGGEKLLLLGWLFAFLVVRTRRKTPQS